MLVNKQQAPSESKTWPKKKKTQTGKKQNKKQLHPGTVYLGGASAPSSLHPLICGGKGPITTWVGAGGLSPTKTRGSERRETTARELRGDPARAGVYRAGRWR